MVDPTSAADWDEWVSAGRTRNYLEDDPLLDWLDRHGRAKGFVPDDELEGFDTRTDFLAFTLSQGMLFEEKVMELLGRTLPVVRIGHGWQDSLDLLKAQVTFDAMCAGEPVIHQGVLRNPENRTYGSVDLLVRSDVLDRIVPGTLAGTEREVNAPALGPRPWHYRVVDIKFSTLQLLRSGHASSDHLAYMAQVWLYNTALGRIQGWTPPSAYLLGRSWKSSLGRGTGCLERLARVDDFHVINSTDVRLATKAAAAVAWIRQVRAEGGSWEVLPMPSVPELYPHARHVDDQPWHRAKAYIAAALAELTLLPGVNPQRRRSAHGAGLLRWDDDRTSASRLRVPDPHAVKCDAVLAANRRDGPEPVLPKRIRSVGDDWRIPAPLELFVDFETVSNLADDFTALPEAGGQPLIFQIGCGWYEGSEWGFWQGTAERLDEPSEADLIDSWIAHIDGLLTIRGLGLDAFRAVHWSHAETSSLDTAYMAARTRHPSSDWPDIPWFDALERVVRAEPVTVRGAFGFGLKSIAKAMQALGLIATKWEDGPTDALGAMVGAWWCAAYAARIGTPMGKLPLMADIGRYNEVDCRAMAEVFNWLRRHR